MNSKYLLLLLTLPLWLASCSPSMDLIGERSMETDEFYLMGGEAHAGDASIEAARQAMMLDQYDEFMDEDYDDPYAGQYGYAPPTGSQLWNRYTPGWSSGMNAGWGSGGGFSPFTYGAYSGAYGFGNPNGFGNQYGFGNTGYSPFNSPYGTTTYGWGNSAFMNGYDAWGNPIGWGNPFNSNFAGGGWGYDPWGGGYWGTPGNGYWINGYHPYYGNMGAYNNGWCGTLANGEGNATNSPAPRPRPSFGQFTGYSGISGGSSGDAPNGTASPKPDVNRGKAGKRNTSRSRGTMEIRGSDNREPNYGRQSPDRSGEQNEQPRAEPDRNRSNRNGGRTRDNWSSPSPRNNATPSPPRGGSTRPSSPRPSSPRPSAPRSGGGRSGRGG